jgi:hypothetical protein
MATTRTLKDMVPPYFEKAGFIDDPDPLLVATCHASNSSMVIFFLPIVHTALALSSEVSTIET